MDTLVFIHGFLGAAAQWSSQVAFFSRNFNVITPDLPGFGEKASEPGCHSIEQFADNVLDSLSDRGIEKFHLVGHSMGGMIAQRIAYVASERLLSKIFYSTGPVGVMPDRFETIARSKQRVMEDGVKNAAERIAASWFLNGINDPAYRNCADMALLASQPSALAGLDAMSNWSGVDYLNHITGKSLVLWGDQDRTYPWPQPEQLWHGIIGANLAVLPGVAHAVHLEKPNLFNQIVLDFLL